ncbi:MAG TPA: 50S ribosomal protein L11 methyltransferase [Vicinamibacteria bacterium]|nr:50S ribosomal protein L11 methyltransferase [Vicinamibacteria bacterium]
MRAFRVTVAAADEDLATASLWEAGTAGIEVRPLPGERVELLAYYADHAPPPSLESLEPGATVERIEVPQVDWVARFRETFRPRRAGRFLVAPRWDVPPVASREVLLVDPGRAFGTGTHETTRLCLGALEDLAARRPLGRTLDLGAGTALLAVAAARLGAAPVVASDLDPEAIASSSAHALLNGAKVHVVRADGGRGFRTGAFDLVLANLMALLLVDRSAEIPSLLAPGGALVLSGLLLDDVPFVRRAFAACGAPRERVDGEWAALVYEP